jgi:hypothetical protein
MRWKIITVHSIIVILVGVFLGSLLWAQLRNLVADQSRIGADASKVAAAANAQLQFDGLRIERWLDGEADNPALRDLFELSIKAARFESATEQCNRIQANAARAPQLAGLPPAVVALVDANGVALGRNGSNLMRGENLGAAHPRMKHIISKGLTGSSIWYSPKLSQQWFVSFAAVRSADGNVIGGLVYGTPLNDERLTRTTDRASGGAIAIAINSERGIEAIAKSASVPQSVAAALTQPTAAAGVKAALKQGAPTPVPGAPNGWLFVGTPLEGYGAEATAALVAIAPSSAMDTSGLLWSVAAAVLLGLVLVAIAGSLLGNYVSRPVEQLEDGLLQILNGRTDLRFEIEHAVLGGLVFRINTLLNQLMGVQEDDTDDEGRPSLAPSAQRLQGALEVDEKQGSQTEQVDAALATALAAEPAESYYPRIFREYIEAKRTIGDPVDHITEASFVARIHDREKEMGERTGRSVRYQVQLRGREVVLIAVQLP